MIEFEVKEEMRTIASNDAIDQFCIMADMVASVDLNQNAAKIILSRMPTDYLNYFHTGLSILRKLADDILTERYLENGNAKVN